MNKYIDDNLDELPPENRKNVEEVIAKYSYYKWWRFDGIHVETDNFEIDEDFSKECLSHGWN